MPTSAAASSSIAKLLAAESSRSPPSVDPIPKAREKGFGRRSVTNPTTGWRIEAVSWKVSVIKPILTKLSAKEDFSSG